MMCLKQSIVIFVATLLPLNEMTIVLSDFETNLKDFQLYCHSGY